MLVKAKTENLKEGILNLWKAMSGQFSDEYWKQGQTETKTLYKFEGWDVFQREDYIDVIDST